MRITDRSPIGTRGVEVSKLGMGTTTMGNLFQAVSDDDSDATLRHALDQGIAHIDTAPYYGAGLAEERVGRILKEYPRESVTVGTKVGRRLRNAEPGEHQAPEGYVDTPPRIRYWDFTGAGIRASLEESLTRLGLDSVDILYLHDPDDFAAEALASAFPELVKMRDEGIVGAIGCGMNQWELLLRFVNEVPLDVILLAGRYTLLDQSGLDQLLPLCEQQETKVVIGGAFNSGLLADPRPGSTYNYIEAPAALVTRAQRLRDACAEFDVPLTAAALQFPFGHHSIAGVLTGSRSEAEIAANIRSFEWSIPDDLWSHLKAEGLLPAHVPVPGSGAAGPTDLHDDLSRPVSLATERTPSA